MNAKTFRPCLLLTACLLLAPTLATAALEAIDEGEVAIGQAGVAVQKPGCPAVDDQPFAETTIVDAGTLTVDSIQKTFEENVGALGAVYQRALAANPCLSGSVRVHIVTAATGLVARIDLEFSNRELSVIRKVLAQTLGRFRFELTGTPASFGYTLYLHPK